MHRKTAVKILDLCRNSNVDKADVFLRSFSSTTVEIKEQKVDAFDRAQDIGAGLRVFVNGRAGFAFATDFTDKAVTTFVRSAITNAENAELDPWQALAPKSLSPYRTVSVYDPELVRLGEREKIERVMSMEREAFAVDHRIKRIRKASASFSAARTIIVNTNGAEVEYESTACSSSIEVVAEDKGESQAGSEFDVNRFYGKLEIEQVGRKAARRAVELLGARHIDSTKAPVILDSIVAQEFLAMIASGFSAENVQKRKSLLIGKLGQQIVSSAVTVYDDGLLEGGLGTAPSDDETVPVQKKKVIDQGVLSMFLHNMYTANKDKTVSTGNGMRGGFKGVPGVGITNLYIEPGTTTVENLMKRAGKGLYVIDVMGMHTANPISGDFSIGATGFWIENGKKAYPVREVTIAGNILDLMMNVDTVGSDIRFSGRIGSPSLLIKELSIGGK